MPPTAVQGKNPAIVGAGPERALGPFRPNALTRWGSPTGLPECGFGSHRTARRASGRDELRRGILGMALRQRISTAKGGQPLANTGVGAGLSCHTFGAAIA